MSIKIWSLAVGIILAQLALWGVWLDGKTQSRKQVAAIYGCDHIEGGDEVCITWRFTLPVKAGDIGDVIQMQSDGTAKWVKLHFMPTHLNESTFLPSCAIGCLLSPSSEPAPSP